MKFFFANPGETLLALADAMPYLDDAGRRAAAAMGTRISNVVRYSLRRVALTGDLRRDLMTR